MHATIVGPIGLIMDTSPNSKYHILQLILFLSATVAGQNVSPSNTAADAGTPSTSLNCANTGATSNQFVWSFTNYTSGTTSNVATGCSPFNTQLYGIQMSTANTCNLVILTAQPSQAGLYTCSPGGQTASSAQFIVMTTTANCDNTPLGGNEYTFTCSATFIGYMAPDVTWYSGSLSGGKIPSTFFNTTNSVSAAYNVTINNSSDIPPNLCQVNFTVPSNPPTGQAANAPSYTSNCSVTNLTPLLDVTTTELPCNNCNATNNTGDSVPWIVVFSIFTAGSVTVVVVDFLCGFKVVKCRSKKEASSWSFYVLIGVAGAISVTGIIVGALLISGVIYTYCCGNWIGGFTMVLSFTTSGVIIMFGFFCKGPIRVEPDNYREARHRRR